MIRRPLRTPSSHLRFALSVCCLSAFGCRDARAPAPCDECIELEPVVSLEFESAPFFAGIGGKLAVRADEERFAFMDGRLPFRIMVFDGAGERVAILGGLGDAAGEFRGIGAMAFDRNDRLWVFDVSGKFSVYAPDFELERTDTVPVSVRSLQPMRDGDWLMAAWGEFGLQPRVMERSGEVRQFTSLDPPAEGWAATSEMTVVGDGAKRAWFATQDYRVLEFDSRGNLRARLEKPPGWSEARFSDEMLEAFGGNVAVPGASLLSMGFDGTADILWVFQGVPAGEVPPHYIQEMRDGMRRPEQVLPQLIDHVLEAIDATTGRRISSRRFDFLPLVLTGRHGFYLDTDSIGVAVVEVVRPVIRTVPLAGDTSEVAIAKVDRSDEGG